jgi:hypothetical protein
MKFCIDITTHVNYPNSKFQDPTLSITNVNFALIREAEV